MLWALFKPGGRLLVGSLLIFGGFVFGLASHDVTNHQAPTGTYTALTLENGNVDLRLNESDTYYTINASDFTLTSDRVAFPNKRMKSLMYMDEPTTLQLLDAHGNRVEGTGYPVEEFTLANADETDLQTFTTAEYRQNPGGFSRNYWLGGMGSVALGAFLILLTFFLAHRGIQPISKPRFAGQRTAADQGA